MYGNSCIFEHLSSEEHTLTSACVAYASQKLDKKNAQVAARMPECSFVLSRESSEGGSFCAILSRNAHYVKAMTTITLSAATLR